MIKTTSQHTHDLLTKTFPLLALALFAIAPATRATDTESVLPNGNTADGAGVLISLTSGIWNTGFGLNALHDDTSGSYNTAQGYGALTNDANGSFNTADGTQALFFNVGGYRNTAVGSTALYRNTANNNTAVGASALFNNTSPENNAFGVYALQNNTTGMLNSAFGTYAMQSNSGGSQNAAFGNGALRVNTTGYSNTAIGYSALSQSTGAHNIGLGNYAGEGVTTANNVIVIGSDLTGENVSNGCYIANIWGVTASGGAAVYVNAYGKLGTATSSRRFKDDIQPMNDASAALLDLQPVTFRYKKDQDPAQKPQFGLVAEDVAKVNPDLVIRDKDGKPYTVRYEAVNAMLLNEFLKEHKKVQTLESELAEVKAQLTQQAVQIEKVAAQVQTQAASPLVSQQ